jgi:hypothetical protein
LGVLIAGIRKQGLIQGLFASIILQKYNPPNDIRSRNIKKYKVLRYRYETLKETTSPITSLLFNCPYEEDLRYIFINNMNIFNTCECWVVYN